MNLLIPQLKEACGKASSVVFCVDETVLSLWAQDIEALRDAMAAPSHILSLPSGESQKSLEQATHCWSELLRLGVDRRSVLVALGGGVVCDLIGFVAATYMRGLRCVMIPTTLLAMVDAAIGGKNGVNLPQGKNLIGTIRQPEVVLTDTCWLRTLPERELRSGLAEVVKYGLIADLALLERLEDDPIDWSALISRSQEIKQRIVDVDPMDCEGVRRVLNFGHTFARAFEAISSYELLRHGEAVAIGMLCAMDLSEELGHVSRKEVEYLEALLVRLGLPTQIDGIDIDALILIMMRDKKVEAGHLKLILARGWGEVYFAERVELPLVRQVLERRCAKVTK